MIKRLAIIPAREGSKRIKNKNLKKINNQYLLTYSLNAIIKSRIFSKIHVSSDSLKILRISEKLNIRTDFIRPKNLSNDYATLWMVIKYVVKKYLKMNMHFDEIWLLFPTNPFINSKIIIDCSKYINKQISKKPLMIVTKYNYPPEWCFEIDKDGLLNPLYPKKQLMRSQDLTTKYSDAGMITIYPSNYLYSKKKIDFKFLPYFLPIYESVDIDTKEDFILAKKLFINQNYN